ncbi:MAG: archaetidylserine decarboxylase [Pseudomonadota bacterium]
MSIWEKLFIGSQYVIPQHALSQLCGKLADLRTPFLKNWAINTFIRQYNVNMQEAEFESAEAYQSFNDFFTRQLKPGVRTFPEDDNIIASPVDGAISQIGQIRHQSIIQAKNHHYSLSSLLAKDSQYENHFKNGAFATLYLSPKDYHRIHMPMNGRLLQMTHVPGRLFSVNPTTANNIPGLFARNERIIAYFETHLGPVAVIFVGATIVGSIATQWSGVVTPPSASEVSSWQYDSHKLHYEMGQEIGRFLLGSTVILLFPENTVSWLELAEGDAIQLGQPIARIEKY